MSTFISGVANPMTERRPPKTPFVDPANRPPLPPGMTKEQLEDLIEKKRAEWGQKINAIALGSKPMRQPPTKGTKNTRAEASVN